MVDFKRNENSRENHKYNSKIDFGKFVQALGKKGLQQKLGTSASKINSSESFKALKVQYDP